MRASRRQAASPAAAKSAGWPTVGRSPSDRFSSGGSVARMQGGRGTCSVFAMTAAIEYAVATKQQQRHAAERRVSQLGRQRRGPRGDRRRHVSQSSGGASPPTAFAPRPKCRTRTLSTPPQNPTRKRLPMPRRLRALGLQLHWIKRGTRAEASATSSLPRSSERSGGGWPVCRRFPLAERREGPCGKSDVLQMCPRKDVMDGHSVLLVGFRDDKTQPGGGVFLIRNSAGRTAKQHAVVRVRQRLHERRRLDRFPRRGRGRSPPKARARQRVPARCRATTAFE